MTSIQRTNSWHWLLISIVVSLVIGGFLWSAAWKKNSAKNLPAIERMTTHGDKLKHLHVEDAILVESQVAKLEKGIIEYSKAVAEQAGQPVPVGENEALKLSNEIARELINHQLRIVEQEQTQEAANTINVPPEPRRAAAARAMADAKAKQAQAQEKLPYHTREIRYVLEGEYRHMFMFLVRQSHLKPSYHFKDIKILPSPHETGMRMEFVVQIHYS